MNWDRRAYCEHSYHQLWPTATWPTWPTDLLRLPYGSVRLLSRCNCAVAAAASDQFISFRLPWRPSVSPGNSSSQLNLQPMA